MNFTSNLQENTKKKQEISLLLQQYNHILKYTIKNNIGQRLARCEVGKQQEQAKI